MSPFAAETTAEFLLRLRRAIAHAGRFSLRDPTSRWLATVVLLFVLTLLLPAESWGESPALLALVAGLVLAAWVLFVEQRRDRLSASRTYRKANRMWARREIRLGGFLAWTIMIFATSLLAMPYAIMSLSSLLLPVPRVEPRTLMAGSPSLNGYASSSGCVAESRSDINALVQRETSWTGPERTAAARLSKCTLIRVRAESAGAVSDSHISILQFCGHGGLMQTDCETTPAPGSSMPSVVNGQTEALLELLTRNRQSLVVVYVHGWRHDDRSGDDDLRRFVHLANYSAAFVKSPLRMPSSAHAALQHPLHVVAVYVGWRGNQLHRDDGGALSTILAALTFPARKRASEAAAKQVVDVLKHIEGHLEALNQALPQGSRQRNRMLVVGHSAGGNLLMHGLQERMAEALRLRTRVAEWEKPMRGPLGDLTVLINPASEARRWTAIQESFYSDLDRLSGPRRARIGDSCSNLACLFTNEQPPTVMSITAGASSLSDDERAERLSSASPDALVHRVVAGLPTRLQDRLLVVSDWVTEFVFPLSQVVFAGHWFDPAARSTIGHFIAPDTNSSLGRSASSFRPPGSRLGLSHLLEINGKAEGGTAFLAAATLLPHQCAPDRHWLWFARAARPGIGQNEFARQRLALVGRDPTAVHAGWDGNHTGRGVKSFGVIQRARPFLNAQFAHLPRRPWAWLTAAPKPENHQDLASPMPPTFPYWNVAALDSVLEDHGRFISYPLWCSLNQFVLDDPAERPGTETIARRRPHDGVTPPSPSP